MPNETVAGLLISIDANTVRLRTEMDKAKASTRAASQQMKKDMGEARGSIMVLGEEIGVHLPRHVQRFVAGLPGVASAMSAAFNTIAVLAIAQAIFEAGKKLYEFAQKAEEAARKHQQAWRAIAQPMRTMNDELDLTKTKLENAIAKLEHKPQNLLKQAIEEATVAADKLDQKLGESIGKIAAVLKEQQVSWFSRTLLHQTAGVGPARLAADTEERLQQAAAGTLKVADLNANADAFFASRGDRDAQQRYVVSEALSRARAALAIATADAEHIAALQSGMRYANPSAAAQDVKGYTRLVAGLSAMQHEVTTTQDIVSLEAQRDRDEAAGKGPVVADVHKPILGPMPKGPGSTWVDPVHASIVAAQQRQRDKLLEDQATAEALAAAATDAFYQQMQNSAMPNLFGAAGAPTVKGPSQWQVFADQMDEHFKDWIDRATDLSSIMSSTFDKSMADFNSAIVKKLTEPDSRGAWKDMGKSMFTDVTRSALEYGEGTLMKGLGLGKRDGSSAASALFVQQVGGAGAAAGAGGIFSSMLSGFGGAPTAGTGDGAAGAAGFGAFVQDALPFFGGMADGGLMSPGGFYLTGERGPELLQVGAASRIHNTRDTASLFNGGDHHEHHYHIDARGSHDPAAVRLAVQRGIIEAAPAMIAASVRAHGEAAARRPGSVR